MAAALTTLVDHCVSGLTVNEAQATHNVAHSAIAATILSPYLATKPLRTSFSRRSQQANPCKRFCTPATSCPTL